eukprot:574348-Hanusia_phi.AAC.2
MRGAYMAMGVENQRSASSSRPIETHCRAMAGDYPASSSHLRSAYRQQAETGVPAQHGFLETSSGSHLLCPR